jgi:predicted nucleic acid-binding protein
MTQTQADLKKASTICIGPRADRALREPGLRDWIAAVKMLDIDDGTTHSYAAIGHELKKNGKPIPANDLWIAALCRQHALPLLSRDRHFDLVPGLRRIDW